MLGSIAQAVTIVGSSMGASIIWAYIELYGHDRLARAVFVDQVALRLTFSNIWLFVESLQ